MKAQHNPTPADRIRDELEAIAARNRGDNPPTPADAPPAPRQPGRARHFLLWGLAALAVNAAVVGVLHYSLSNPAVISSPVAPAEPPPTEPYMEIVADAPPATPALPPTAPATPATEPPPPSEHPAVTIPVPAATKPPAVGTIVHNGRVVTYPISTPTARPTPPPQPAPPPPRPRPAPVVTTPAPPAVDPTDKHAKAAEKYAYNHFRYKYKVGSSNYAVTSLAITLDSTAEVPGWSRYRSTGEAGIEYYDGSGFRRTTRRFEVITETKSGRITATKINVIF